MKSWYSIRARGEGAELSIYDEIGAYGVSAKAFIADLGDLPDGTPLELRLNSPGGSVFDAVAIYNALQRHAGTVTVTIDGIAASAASYIAMAGDAVVMPENAFLMIHDPSGLVMGTAANMRAMAEALDKIAGSLIRGYAAKSGKSEEDIAALMAAETWFDAAEAVEAGFADRLAEPVRIAASFDIARFRNAPPDLVETVAQAPAPEDAKDADAETSEDGSADDSDGADPDAADVEDAEAGPDDDPDQDGAEKETGDPLTTEAPPNPAPPDTPNPTAIRSETMTYAKAVVDLCRLAGQPQMAAGLLDRETDLEAVRKTLIEARAKSEPEITAAHPQPGPSPTSKPWGDVIARTFKLKG